MSNFKRLDDDIIIDILTLCDTRDVNYFGQTCKGLKTFLENDVVWKFQCATNWLLEESSQAEDPQSKKSKTEFKWRQLYQETDEKIGKEFRKCYARVKKCWNRLEIWLNENAPPIKDTLQAGADHKEILQAKNDLQKVSTSLKFPVEFLCWQQIHNGQGPLRVQTITYGLLGGFEVYDYDVNFHFQPMTRIPQLASAIHNQLSKTCIPFAMDPTGRTGAFWIMDAKGQVNRFYSGFTEYHKASNSFIEFMEDYVKKLESGIFTPLHNYQIERYPNNDPQGSDVVTRGVRIQVSVLHVPERKARDGQKEFFFTYRVRITFEGDSDMKATLTTRCWDIHDGSGRPPSRVDHQPGVIGLYPRVYAGMEPFTYRSCSTIRSRKGFMQGSFQFRVDDTDEEFDAIVGKFKFDVDENAI